MIRVLYRLRFASEAEQFDIKFFNVVLVFLESVIRRNGSGMSLTMEKYDVEGDVADSTTSEQTVLAIEILAFHSQLGKLSDMFFYHACVF